jgi:hypothetical protein
MGDCFKKGILGTRAAGSTDKDYGIGLTLSLIIIFRQKRVRLRWG